jgi:hypothetical protein
VTGTFLRIIPIDPQLVPSAIQQSVRLGVEEILGCQVRLIWARI